MMNRIFIFLIKLIGYALLSVLALVLVVGPPFVSWRLADDKLNDGARLRSFYTVDKTVLAGSKLQRTDLEHGLAYLGPDEKVLHASAIVGRFAVETIAEGSKVTQNMVKQRHVIAAASDTIIVQVRVGAEYAESITPGMHLAFVREETLEKTDADGNEQSQKVILTLGLPSCADKTEEGFPVVSIQVAEGEDPQALIDVELQEEKVSLGSTLALHEWRPIVLGEGACGKFSVIPNGDIPEAK
ncbi:MAG: hypothetical protein V3T55_06025 [Anaerolineales bacterium]